jgi:hypothetical protein
MKRRTVVFVLALALSVAFFCGAVRVRAEETPTVRVYITFEGYNVGDGFYVVLRGNDVPQGTSAMDFTVDTLEMWGYDFDLTPWGGLDRIYDIHSGWVFPPSYITVEIGEGAGDGSLGSFDYTEFSGWIFTVNHGMPEVSAEDFILSDGDVIRWQFSIEGWGADLGLGIEQGFWTEPLYEHMDKSDLIRSLFGEGMHEYFQEVLLSLIIDPLATEESVIETFTFIYEIMQNIVLTWNNPFSDVSEDDWFYYAVGFMYENGWIAGVKRDIFDPHGVLTRAMLVTLLWRMAEFPVVAERHVFDDVPQDRWFSLAAAWAADIGLVEAGDNFYPNQAVTDLDFYNMIGYDVFWEDPYTLTRADIAEIIYDLLMR